MTFPDVVLYTMGVMTVWSLYVVFKEKREPAILTTTQYGKSFNKILNEEYQLCPAMETEPMPNIKKNKPLVHRQYGPSFNKILSDRGRDNDVTPMKYGQFFDNLDLVFQMVR